MDKTFIAVLALALAVSVGVTFAASGWRGFDVRMPGEMAHGNWTFNGTGNFTDPHGFARGEVEMGCQAQNGSSGRACWFEGNESFNGTRGLMRGREAMNGTFNSTAMEEFQNAVLSGDYAAASSLHSEYGFGGPMFGKLNETTFATYSQIAVLSRQLHEELGLNSTMPGLHEGIGMGLGHGEFEGRMPPPAAEGGESRQ
ncbi:MAG: hypothetical protein WC506_06685 [Candidatus Micrarchaeia archaeon]